MPGSETKSLRFKLLGEAANLISVHGYAQVRVEDITSAAGVSKGTFYNYFNSKGDLLCAIFDGILTQLHGTVVEASMETCASPTAALRHALKLHTRVVLESRKVLKVFLREQASLDPECRKLVGERTRRYQSVIERIIARGIDKGEFTQVPPFMAAANVLAVCNGPHVWFDPSGVMTVPEVAEQCADFAVRGLCDVPSPSLDPVNVRTDD